MMRRFLRSPRAAGSGVVLAAALAFGLSACTPDTGAAPELRNSVVEIAELSAAGDFAGALAELELLVGELDAAVTEGKIDAAREQEIRAAIDLVRADLEAAVAAANTPAPAPADDGADDDDGDGDDNSGNGNGNGGGGDGGNSGNGGGNGDGGDSGGDSGDGDQSTAPATEPPATEPPATEPPATEPPATEGTSDGG